MAAECGSIGDFENALAGRVGTVETGAIAGWRLLIDRYPQAKLVVVTRPIGEIVDSFSRAGFGVPSGTMTELNVRAEMLRGVAQLPGVLAVTFDELRLMSVCKAIFEHTLELEFDYTWWDSLKDTNIQVDMSARLRQLQQNAPRLAALKAEIERETAKLGDMRGRNWN
ncbi:hypothetical protein M0Q28_05915 [Patescibacteria group bacterium]|nr:hypothetical protein [Patescibacteria group bacterium]